MTATTIDKPRTATYDENIEALLASGSPVRLLDQYAEFKAATEGRRVSR